MEKQKKIGFIGLFLLSAIASTLVFQNCSKVNYDELSDKKVKTTGQVNRVINLNPTFNSENSAMKVLFIVDDSYTMSQSQTRLSNAVDSLVNPLFGRDVEFKVVSTSGIPSNEIDYEINRKYFDNNGTEISATQISLTPNYIIDNQITNRTTDRHPRISSLKNFTTLQFNGVKTKIKTAILNVGVNGSDTEEGFCPAVRQLFDTSASSFFKKGDKAAIIFLTDEDDSSSFSTCVSNYKQQVSNKPVVYYSYLEQRAKLTLEYQAERDGLAVWIPVTWGIGLPNGQYFNANGTCNASDVSIATKIITDKGYVVRNISACVYEAAQSTRYGADLGDDGTNPNLNLCTATVTFQTATYPNLYRFITASNLSAVSESCQKSTLPANTISNIIGAYTSVIASDQASTSLQDLTGALINKSGELFGTGFIMAHIIRKSNESCALQSGQAYGVKYENLALQLPGNSVVESLCAVDFTNVLSQVSQFIVTSANNSYVVSGLTEPEVILGVAVKRDGQAIALNTSQFEIVGSAITLIGFKIQAGDILEVSVGTR
ncbi:MAG: hypothetical protein H7Z71_04770 [Moraxellaceae bacterium]|nr:hypothetical protein [Pseudobdellovibrionaceae bacterium]